jgi:hypothetical protein
MHLIDLLEMIADWVAAAEQRNGSIEDSLRHNIARFEIDSQLACVLTNTVALFKQYREQQDM